MTEAQVEHAGKAPGLAAYHAYLGELAAARAPILSPRPSSGPTEVTAKITTIIDCDAAALHGGPRMCTEILPTP
jgi:hypothetical protein